MPKRSLRVVKWIGTVPVVAVCVACSREFKVPTNVMGRALDAQEKLRIQFVEHVCKPEEAEQSEATCS